MIDYTTLLKKLTPDRDGEPHLHLRTMTVATVNADGTVDLTTSGGVTIPDVARLESGVVSVGEHVQVLTGRGIMLVLGSTQGSGLGSPSAMLARNTVQSHANNAWSVVSMNLAVVDTHGGWSGGGYAAPIAGIYDVAASGSWASNVTGRRGVRLTVNGSFAANTSAIITPAGSGEISLAGSSSLLNLAAGDLVEVETYQNSGGALNNGAGGGYYPTVRVIRVSG